MNGARPRAFVLGAGITILALFFVYAFWPRALPVDMAAVSRGPLMVTIDEEAKTRVRDAYVVAAPTAGRLLRVDIEPGDAVLEGETVVAEIMPAVPPILDVRTEEQAKAAVDAASAALALAEAERTRARADADYAKSEFERARYLARENIISAAALDRAENLWASSSAALETAAAAVAMREADLENARAMLISFTEAEKLAFASNPHPKESIVLTAPISGRVLRVMEESERTLSAGAPILEIGDPLGDLEVVAELLSTDAVKASPGDRVIVEKWGGERLLEGEVERIEPWGFTKFSALGVEEQRVNTIITFTDQPESHARLGPGYRVDVRIVIWEDDDALKVPSNAVFRAEDGASAVFKVENGRARQTIVEAGRTNGLETQIVKGLTTTDKIILYPGGRVSDGARVKARSF